MVIFLYNLCIFEIHLQTVLYPKLGYNEQFYKEVCVYLLCRLVLGKLASFAPFEVLDFLMILCQIFSIFWLEATLCQTLVDVFKLGFKAYLKQ